MTVKFLNNIPFIECKSYFASKLPTLDSLPQRKELTDFILDNNIQDFSLIADRPHDTIGLIINHRYHSLDDLTHSITNASKFAQQYLYLAINKFYVYSTVDRNHSTPANSYDHRLAEFCADVLKDQFRLLTYTVRPDDDGSIGNFEHPATTMFFTRHA